MFEVCAALIEAVEFLEEHRVYDVGADLVVYLDEFEAAACLSDFLE